MNITELLITGYDGARTLFAATLTAEEGTKVVRPGNNEEGDSVVGEAWEKSADAFVTVRDLMNDIASTSERGESR